MARVLPKNQAQSLPPAKESPRNIQTCAVVDSTDYLAATIMTICADGGSCKILAKIKIIPCQPAHPAAVKAVLEEQDEIRTALMQDRRNVFREEVTNTYEEDDNLSEETAEEGAG